MKLVAIVIAILVIAGSLAADYKWRQWMAARRREQEDEDSVGRR